MKPLMIAPCPVCGNANVSEFVRCGEKEVKCVRCGHVKR